MSTNSTLFRVVSFNYIITLKNPVDLFNIILPIQIDARKTFKVNSNKQFILLSITTYQNRFEEIMHGSDIIDDDRNDNFLYYSQFFTDDGLKKRYERRRMFENYDTCYSFDDYKKNYDTKVRKLNESIASINTLLTPEEKDFVHKVMTHKLLDNNIESSYWELEPDIVHRP